MVRFRTTARQQFRTIRTDTDMVPGGTDTPVVDTVMVDGATSAGCINAHKHRAYKTARPCMSGVAGTWLAPGPTHLKLPPYGRGGPNQPVLRGAAQQPEAQPRRRRDPFKTEGQ